MKYTLSKHTSVGLLLLGIALLPLGSRVLGLSSLLSAGQLREFVLQAGPWAPLAFVTLFVGAVIGQVPGVAFVVAAPALFPLSDAWLLCVLASNFAVILNFALVRRFGGQPLASLRQPRLDALLARLDRQPVRTVALLRLLTVMLPPVTGALALTQVSARDHALGSALGMLLPVTAILLAAALAQALS